MALKVGYSDAICTVDSMTAAFYPETCKQMQNITYTWLSPTSERVKNILKHEGGATKLLLCGQRQSISNSIPTGTYR